MAFAYFFLGILCLINWIWLLRLSGYLIPATSTREVSDFCPGQYPQLVQVNLNSSYDYEFVQFILILLTLYFLSEKNVLY